MKKAVIWCLLLALACGRRAACAGETDVHIDEKVTYQTVESFGTSGC